MATGGAALFLSCALFFFFRYTASPAFSCPDISPSYCKENPMALFKDPQACWVNSLVRCRDSAMEIQFGGIEPWYKVIKGGDYDEELEIEDPTLSLIFKVAAACSDFLFTFPPPGPPFTSPETLPVSNQTLQSYCGESDCRRLFSGLIKRYQGGPRTGYGLCCTSKALQDLGPPALGNKCLPGPDPADTPMFIWKLAKNNADGSFSIVSAGFSRRYWLHPDCFMRNMTGGGDCESGSAGNYTRVAGNKHGDTRRKLITGTCTAAGVALSILVGLLIYLWRRNRKTKTLSSSTLLSHTASSVLSFQRDPEAESILYPTHVFGYEELHQATNGFDPSNELDSGGHGTVYRGTLPDGRPVAIKRLYENGCKRAEQFLNEIDILSHLRHPNLVALYGCTSRHSRELLLVYEFVPNGTIADHLHGRRAAEGALTWPLRLRIAVETATALAYLHALKPQIIHRDVKTNNILLDGDFRVKVADFGLSRLFPLAASHVSTVPQGTPGYVDPEYHRCFQLTDKSDVYSFGVVLAELISSKPAVDVTRHRHEINLSIMALNKIQSAALAELVDPKLGFETDCEVRRSIELVAELVMRCLQGEGDLRPSMDGVLEVLRATEVGLHQADKGGEVDRSPGDEVGLLKNRAPVSPDSVIGKWSSRSTTPNASG